MIPQPKRPNPTEPSTGMSDLQMFLFLSPLIFMLGFFLAALLHSVIR